MKKIFFIALCLSPLFNAQAETFAPEVRALAVQGLTPELRAECLKDFAQKSQREITPLSELAYNETVTRAVYDTLFWTEAERGVAFTLPVKAGEMAGNLACFYALSGQGLRFQLSQQLQARL